MKKLTTLLLGLSFVLGSSALFAQNQPKTDDTKMEKKKKSPKKKKSEKKEEKKEGTR